MILKNQGRKKIHKMGSIISKPKEKLQKKEGLIAQMKTKTEVISQFTQITLYCTTLPLPTPHIVNTICCHPVDNNMSIDLSFTKISFILKKNNPEKRKTEGETSTILVLIYQAESPSKKAPSPSRKSPSPPPRRLSSTLETASLTREFLTFLQDLDKASLLPQNESGRAQTLQFVLEVGVTSGN